MADPVDFFADYASVNANPNGYTLIFVRSMPMPTNRTEAETQGEITMQAEIVARVRFTPVFATQLRDLLDRIIKQQGGADGMESAEVVGEKHQGEGSSAEPTEVSG